MAYKCHLAATATVIIGMHQVPAANALDLALHRALVGKPLLALPTLSASPDLWIYPDLSGSRWLAPRRVCGSCCQRLLLAQQHSGLLAPSLPCACWLSLAPAATGSSCLAVLFCLHGQQPEVGNRPASMRANQDCSTQLSASPQHGEWRASM